jgi:mono/diheme cytochrome c family protein
MRDFLKRRARWVAAGVATLAVTSAAFALPWDTDMTDSQAVKAYEQNMGTLPAGVASQDQRISPKVHRTNYKRGSAEAEALSSPIEATPENVALGGRMFSTYCSPCHGSDGVNLGAVAQPGRLPGVVPLAGAAGVAKLRTDSWIYLTIRNGGAVMPSYGWAMSDHEMWATVAYVRTLENSKYVPPAPEVP